MVYEKQKTEEAQVQDTLTHYTLISQILFKADWLGVVIVQLSFEKPKLKVYIFNRATLSSFAMMEFTTKEDLIKRNRHFYLLV